jgi:hypothetical protein
MNDGLAAERGALLAGFVATSCHPGHATKSRILSCSWRVNGEVAAERQRDIIRELARPMESEPQMQEILKQLMRATQRTAAEWENGTSAREGVESNRRN